MTTFNKLLAIKDGGGNPGAPASGDDLQLTLNSIAAGVVTFDITAGGNQLLDLDGSALAFGNATNNPAFSFLGAGDFSVAGDALFSATGGNTSDPDFQVDGYAKFAGVVELADDLSVGGDLMVTGTSDLLGNVTVGVVGPLNPPANLTVTGISTLTGAVSAGDTLDVTNGATIGGTLGVTGAVDLDSTLNVDGNATFAASATVNGNLTVLGTLVTKQTESVLISDNYIDMNSDYTTVSPQDTGLTFNYSPIAEATITAMDSATDTITLSANSGISLNPGDIVLVTGLDTADVQNEGLYEVLTFANDVITVNVASGLTFLKHAVAVTVSGIQATLAHVNLGVLRVATTGDLQYGENSDANITFGDVPYNGYEGSQSWTSNLSLTAPMGSQVLSFFTVSDPSSLQVFGITPQGTTVSSDLLVSNAGTAQTSYALSLNQVADGHPTVVANFGKVYTKSETTNSVAITELFYTSEINGVDTPVQITKNGQLNVDVLTFSLQAAYEDGNTIVTDAQYGGAVSITAGANLTDALDLTGNLSVDGEISVTNLADFSKTGGSSIAPDFSVAGYAKFAGDVEVTGILDLNGSLDADVTSFDVLSSGALNLNTSAGDLAITASVGDVIVTGATIQLKGSFVASNINTNATAQAITSSKAVAMTSAGLVAAQANAKDVIVLGVTVAQIASSSTAWGKIAEFGRVDAAVQTGISITAGDKLYLSAATAGAVTNVAPTASDTTVFLMGVALTADTNGIVEMALRPQFLYSNY